MALGSVADAVHTLHDGVHSGVVAYGRVGAVKVVVDGTGQTHAAHVEHLGEVAGTGKRTITSDNYQRVYLLFLQGLVRLLLSFFSHKLLGAGCLQDGSTRHDDAAHVLRGEVCDLVVD